MYSDTCHCRAKHFISCSLLIIWKMGRPVCIATREALVQAYSSTVGNGRKERVANLFKGVVQRRTVYDILTRYDECGTIIPFRKTGRPITLATKTGVRKLSQLVDHKDKMPDSLAAKKMGWSRSYVQKVRSQQLNIKKYKKRWAPFYKRGQDTEVQTKCRRLLRKTFLPGSTGLIVMDDEHYIYLDENKTTSTMFYNSSDRNATPATMQVKPVRKFCPKLMVWQALSMRGRSQLYVVPSGMNVNKELYLKECIKKRLIPFINKAYPNGDAIFWPDKASAHYADVVMDHLQSVGVKVVKKDDNPTNLPQARPVERYWAEIDRRLSVLKKRAENLKELSDQVKKVAKNIPESYVQDLMSSVRTKLRRISDSGVYSVE